MKDGVEKRREANHVARNDWLNSLVGRQEVFFRTGTLDPRAKRCSPDPHCPEMKVADRSL